MKPVLMHAMMLGLVLAGTAPAGRAQASDRPLTMAERAGPWVPPAQRQASLVPGASGAALEAEVQARLQRRFEAADTRRSGLLTRDEAQRAGLGFIARDFAQIDRSGRGAVSFSEVQQHLARRAAAR